MSCVVCDGHPASLMRSVDTPASRYPLVFSNHHLNHHLTVWKQATKPRCRLFLNLGAVGACGLMIVPASIIIDQLVGQTVVAFVPDFLVEAADKGFILLCWHGTHSSYVLLSDDTLSSMV